MAQGLSGSAASWDAPRRERRSGTSRRSRARATPVPPPSSAGPQGSVPPAQPTRRAPSGRQARAQAEARPLEETPTNLIPLARARLLLWATPRGEKVPYEVSRAVAAPLQARCKTAPLCPGEEGQVGLPGWVRPEEPPRGACPYEYETRGECICDRNMEALSAALFASPEARLVVNYLSALGYVVREEAVPPDAQGGTRILNAHAKIGDSHDVRVMSAPGVGELVLVRDLAASTKA